MIPFGDKPFLTLLVKRDEPTRIGTCVAGNAIQARSIE
ncbi:MAG: hypothetical protein ANABAC_0103 [Anaerolineae bacterium]|nr:MAG: hypothetical protein ANABAC_0103 [Anaerolineae bacterium]